jgi:hypothetical protein
MHQGARTAAVRNIDGARSVSNPVDGVSYIVANPTAGQPAERHEAQGAALSHAGAGASRARLLRAECMLNHTVAPEVLPSTGAAGVGVDGVVCRWAAGHCPFQQPARRVGAVPHWTASCVTPAVHREQCSTSCNGPCSLKLRVWE